MVDTSNKYAAGSNPGVPVEYKYKGKTSGGKSYFAEIVETTASADSAAAAVSLDEINEKTVAPGAASGKTAVTGTFNATGQSAAFTPVAGRDFNIKIGTPGAALGNTIVLERSFDGVTFAAVTYPDGTIISWTIGVNTSWSDAETGVSYRLNCTAWTTSAAYRLSQ